jgi:hypothetical protein
MCVDGGGVRVVFLSIMTEQSEKKMIFAIDRNAR